MIYKNKLLLDLFYRLPEKYQKLLIDIYHTIIGFIFSITYRYYKTEGLVFSYPKSRVSMKFRSRFYLDTYELEERTIIKKYIKPQHNVLELGACIGVVSCITNKLLDSSSKHLVVEANPYLIPWILSNKALNKCNFLVEFCAVSEKYKSEFYLHELIVGGISSRKTKNPIDIINCSLKYILKKHGDFDVLIMDIEGGEFQFFTEYENYISTFNIIIFETHDFIIGIEKTEQIRTILKNNSFQNIDNLSLTGITVVEVWAHNNVI